MTQDPSAETPATDLTKPLRPFAAYVLLGANAIWLLLSVKQYLLPGAFAPDFTDRSGGAFNSFLDLTTHIALPLLAVLLATHVAPVLAQSRTIVLAALGEYAVTALFAVVSFLAALFSAPTVAFWFEGLFYRLGLLAIFAVAVLVVLRVAQPLLSGGTQDDRLSQYGRGGFEQQQSSFGGPPPQPGYGAQAPYSGQPAYGEQQQYGERPAYGEQQQYGEQPAYGEPPQYPAEPQYTQQVPPASTYTSGAYTPPSAQVYGTPQPQQSAPPVPPVPPAPSWDQQQPAGAYPYEPPQPPGGWPGQQQPPSSTGTVYGGGGEPAWTGQQQAPYETDGTQVLSPEQRAQAEQARRGEDGPPGQNWYDKR